MVVRELCLNYFNLRNVYFSDLYEGNFAFAILKVVLIISILFIFSELKLICKCRNVTANSIVTNFNFWNKNVFPLWFVVVVVVCSHCFPYTVNFFKSVATVFLSQNLL